MGNNLDCSNKNHKFTFTLWNLLWEIPLPSCSSSPKKQIPTSFIRFHIDAFFKFFTHSCLERPKTTVWIHCSALESGLWWPGAPNLPSTTLGCVDPTLPVHLLSCALNLLLLWGKHLSCREGMGRAEGGSGSGWRSVGGAGRVDKGNFGLWLGAVVPRCPVCVPNLHMCPVPLPSLLVGHCHLQTQVGVTWEPLWLSKALVGGAFPRPNHIPVSGASPQALPSQSIGEGQKSRCGTLVKMNQSLSKLCVYIPKCLARIWRILGYPTIRKVPARGTFVPLIGD